MEVKDIYQKVSSSRFSLKDFSKHIAMLLGREWDDAYYQRIRDILKGKRDSITADEEATFNYWAYVFDNPFAAACAGYQLRDMEREINQLWKYLRTGNYNRKQAHKIIKKLRAIIPSDK